LDALGLISIRLIGAGLVGGPAVARPARIEPGDAVPRSLTRSLVVCVTGHLCDVLPAMALSIAFVNAHRPWWALASMGAGAVALFGTLTRLAAERSSLLVHRNVFERFARTGSLWIALGLCSFHSTSALAATPPLSILLSVGLATYGVVEILNVAGAITGQPAPRHTVTVSMDETGTVTCSTPDGRVIEPGTSAVLPAA
jgi:hypothetical protein